MCVGSEETLYRWGEHLEGVLNVIGSSNQGALDGVEQFPLRSGLVEPPDKDEILGALGRLAVGRAGGLNGLLPDVLKCCGGPLLDYILTLFQTVWKERCVPAEWRDALLVPVPKKGDLSSCNNWRGISLLDVMGKEGLQYRTINTILSAVSMTHSHIKGTPIGQHPLVSRLLRGVYNTRPPQPSHMGRGCGYQALAVTG